MENKEKEMYYFRVEKDRVVKYKVSFSRSVMEEYRRQVIEESSIITPSEDIRLIPPEGDNIFNVKRGDPITEPNIGSYTRYRYTYDIYEFSPLVSWIDRLLDGDDAVIPIFLGDDESQIKDNKKVSYRSKIDALNSECNKTRNDDPEKIFKLQYLQKLIKMEKRNRDQKAPFDLFYIVRQSISRVVKDVMPLEDVIRLIEFTGKTPEELGMYGLDLSDFGINKDEKKKQH